MVALWKALCRDLAAFRDCLRPVAAPLPGLYTYRYAPPGGCGRVHLRVGPDLSGVLFLDVTDVIYLNQTSTEFAKWALDGTSLEEAELRLRARLRNGEVPRAVGDLRSVYEMVGRLAEGQRGCPTCALDALQRRDLFATDVQAPFKADLALTYKCNNDCPHCYNEADRWQLDALPVDDWKRVIDRLTAVGIPHLIFTGGEATLYGGLPELIAYADMRGPICGLNTNGRRLQHTEYASELAAAGLNHVQITLGSHHREVHDRMMNARCFDQTVQGIKNAIAAGLHTITNTTLMHMNATGIEDTISFLAQLGIRTFAINGMIYSGGGFDTGQAIHEREMAPLLIRARERARELGLRMLWYTPTQYCRLSPVELEIGAKRCNAGEYSLCVEPNGDVLPCQSYYVAAGNLLRDPWEQVWRGELFEGFRARVRDPRRYGLPQKCWECPDLALCGGGCRIERDAAEGVRLAGQGSGGRCAAVAQTAVAQTAVAQTAVAQTAVAQSGTRTDLWPCQRCTHRPYGVPPEPLRSPGRFQAAATHSVSGCPRQPEASCARKRGQEPEVHSTRRVVPAFGS